MTAAAALMLWPLVAAATHAIPGELRDPMLEAWILAWDADRIRHGLRGLWEMPILYPYRQTLAFTEHLLGIAIFTAPLQWALNNPILVYNIAFFGSYVFAGVTMFLLARELTGRTDAALVAAFVFAFYPHHLAQSAHLQNIVVGWMPLTLLALHRYFASRPSGSRVALAAAALCFWLEAMSNGYYLFYFGLAVAIVGVWGLAIVDRGRRAQMIRDFAVTALIVVLAYSPIAWRYLDVRRRYEQRRSEDEITRFSADVGSYLTQPLPIASHLRFTLPHFPKPAGPEERHDGMLFPGFAMIALAGVAVAAARTDGHRTFVLLYGAIAATGFLLSLGPRPTIWGHQLLPLGPYAFFARYVPGFNGLRVPARLAVLVYLGLSVLAAFGAARLLRTARAKTRTATTALLIAFALFESYGTIPMAEVGRRGRTRDFGLYTWLRDQPSGAVLELPIGPLDRDYRAFIYQYNTLVHGHRIVNGWSGYSTSLQQWLGSDGSPFAQVDEIPNGIDIVRGLGVRYLIVHPEDFVPRDAGSRMLDAMRLTRDKWTDMRQFGETYAFVLPPAPPVAISPVERLDGASIHVRASHRSELVRSLFDGRRDTTWTSAAPQTGSEWLELEFDRAVDVRRLRFEMDASIFGDYPRTIVVDALDHDGPARLFEGPVAMEFGRGFLEDPMRPAIDLVLPPHSTNRIRIAQTAADEWWWSIGELTVWRALRD